MTEVKRLAALYDIHGNLAALEAVLGEVDELGVDLIVVGGDIVWGPQPLEVAEVLRARRDVAAIRGNADREVAQRLGVADGLPEELDAINAWCAERLGEPHLSWLRDLPFSHVAGVGDDQVLFCHATPRSDEEIVTALTDDDRMATAFANAAETTVVCGHTHMQFDRVSSGKRIVNAGSVGLAYEDEVAAYWALLGSGIELRRTDYDVEATVAAFRASSCPHVEEVFVENLIAPPGRAEVTKQFEALAAPRTSN